MISTISKYRLFFFISIFFFPFFGFSQKEANIWYFGIYAGIDFNSGVAVALTNSAMSQREGCASISDGEGNVLFYTDGQIVYNRDHSIMQNGTGLQGGQSSSQSAIIIPFPGDAEKYYIFTVPEEIGYGNSGIKYSVVDLTLDGGLGAITNEKNIFLITPSMERITGVRHQNGKDVWLLTHLWDSDAFYAYLIDESGIDINPVISNVGSFQSGMQGLAHGTMKVSANGKKLGMAARPNDSFELFDFDNSTGIISNCIYFPSNYISVYGIEFSPDCSKLYFDKYGNGTHLYQYDLMAGTPQEIIDSEVLIAELSTTHVGTLQLAPDHKIYVARSYGGTGTNYLGVINNPNESGTECNFVEEGFYLNGRECVYGLPNFLQNYFIADFTFQPICEGDTTRFEIGNTNSIVSVLWDFDDPDSGSNNSSTLLNPVHIFSAPGIYNVQLSVQYPYNEHEVMHEVTIYPQPQPDLGADTVICGSQQIVLNPGEDFETYLWQDGSTEPTLTAGEIGLYWVEVSNAEGCINRDSIQITFSPGVEISIGNDTTYCFGDTSFIYAGPGFESYLWQDGSTDSVFMATQSGMYWVQVMDEYGCLGYDTINLTFLPNPDISFGNDTLICFNQTLSLNVGEGFDNILWQDGSQGQSFLVSEPGIYWVNVSNDCGLGGDTISVDFSEPFDISLGNDTSFCYGQSYFLDAGEGFDAYLWDDGSQGRFNEIFTNGYHWVTVSDSLGCTAQDSIFVEVFNSFFISINDNDTLRICEGEYIFLNGPDGFESYQWQDGSDYPSLLADTAGTYWLEVTDENGCAARDSVELIVNIIPKNLLGNDTIICPNSELEIHAKPGYEAYVWNNGQSDSIITVNHPGTFWVTVQDEIGCSGMDTIYVDYFMKPSLGLASQEWICPDDTMMLDAGDGYLSYLWNDGTQNQTLEVYQSGNYTVEVETVCGLFSDTVEIKLYQGNLDLGNDTILCDGETLILQPGHGYSNFYWSNGSTDSTLIIGESGEYWLKAYDGFCNVSDSITIDACAEIWIPNVFTPNGDYHNETFYALTKNEAGIINFKMVIFNRWGRVVKTLNHIEDEWDGKINGSKAAEGVYFYECDYSARNKTGKIIFHSKQGCVTLMR